MILQSCTPVCLPYVTMCSVGLIIKSSSKSNVFPSTYNV